MNEKEYVYIIECLYDCFKESDRSTWSRVPTHDYCYSTASIARNNIDRVRRRLMKVDKRWGDVKFRVEKYARVRP